METARLDRSCGKNNITMDIEDLRNCDSRGGRPATTISRPNHFEILVLLISFLKCPIRDKTIFYFNFLRTFSEFIELQAFLLILSKTICFPGGFM